jgi:hypothetical protein
MKSIKQISFDFESHEMDSVITRWLLEGVKKEEKENFEKTLLFDKRFREHFCEWVKAIREPAWALNSSQKEDK